MRKFILLALILACLPFALATDGGYVGDTTRIWSDVILGDSFYSANHITLTLQNPIGTTISVENMTFFSTGIYYYDFVPTQTGNYYAYAQVYNSTNQVVGIGSTTIFAQQNLEQFFGGINMEIFLFIAVFAILYLVGFFTKSYALIIAAGVYSIANLFVAPVIPQSVALNALFSIALGILAVYHGISLILANPKGKQFVREEQK